LFVLGLFLLAPVVHANTYEGGIPLTTEKKGVVSGGLWFDTYPGFAKSAQKYFSPPKRSTIEWARVYVGVYCGHKQNNYDGIAHVALDLEGDGSFETPLGDEKLNVPYSYTGEGGAGPVWVNDHCNRVTSDYLMWYDVKDKITSRPLGVSVNTEPVSKSFDGRIKFIAVVVAYNDDDHDIVYYWVNQGHDPLNSEDNNGYYGETTFSTSSVITENDEEEENLEATLSTLYMASVDGKYTFNGEELFGETPLGAYFGFNKWDVKDQIVIGDDSILKYEEAGTYYKIPLALLTVRIPERDAGTLDVTSNPAGAQILLDGEETGLATNATITGVSTGEHTVEVDMAGNGSFQKPKEATVVILRNEVSGVHFQIASVNGSAKISSEPTGAWIYLDGKNQSVQTDTVLEEVMSGNHTVSLRKTGYETRETVITISKEKPGSVAEKLIPGSSNSTEPAGTDAGSTGYAGSSLELYRHGTVNGGLAIADASAYSGLLDKDTRKGYLVTLDLPKNVTVKDARLYVYTTWSYNTADLKGKPASLRVDYNDKTLDRERSYLDRKGSGTYDYPAETHCYPVSPDEIQSGTMRISVVNTGQSRETFAVYGVVLVIVYEDPAAPPTEYWIGEGSDMIYISPELNTDTVNATTRMAFPRTAGSADPVEASLFAISTAASGGTGNDNRITFNGQGWSNALNGGSSAISIARFNVAGMVLPSGNMATIESIATASKGDYMENRNIILVVRNATADKTWDIPLAFSDIKPDKKNSDILPSVANESQMAPAESGPIEETLDPTKKSYAVRVLSNPPGGLISVDYRYSGKTTPATIDQLPGGNHTFSVDMDGFRPAEQKIFVTGNETLTLALDVSGASVFEGQKVSKGSEALLDQECYGGVYVDSNPENANIYIDGKKTTLVTPSVVYGLSEGKHTVKIMRGSGKDKVAFPVESKDIFIDDGTITPVSFSVSENPFLLNISVRSEDFNGSEFTLNGMRMKYKMPANLNLQYSSDNFVTVKKDNAYVSVPLVIYNSIEQTQEISSKATSFHDLFVESTPSGADIFVDGYATGYATPFLIRNLSEGTHVVFITKSGYVPLSSTVRVNTGDVVRRFVLEEYLNGRLEVTSIPEGGKIYINNRDTGEKTPFTFQYMQAGHYTIKVVQNRTQAIKEDVIVEPGIVQEVNLTLKKKGSAKYGIT
jgi:hypothetical protein